MGTCTDLALPTAPGDTLLGRWTVTGAPEALATGVLVPVRESGTGRQARARVHWPSLAGQRVRRRLEATAAFLALDPHPGWLPLLDAGKAAGGTLVHVMAEAPGGDLQRGDLPLPWRSAATAAAAVGEALGAAHARGALHRDVSPGNILVGAGGRYWLGDWDSARVPGGEEVSKLQRTAPLGTPGFMSPEQEVGGPLDPRSDVFSLGMVLWALLVGRPAIPAGVPAPERFARLTSGSLEPPSALIPECPRAVDDLVLLLIAADPEDRLADGAEAARHIMELLR